MARFRAIVCIATMLVAPFGIGANTPSFRSFSSSSSNNPFSSFGSSSFGSSSNSPSATSGSASRFGSFFSSTNTQTPFALSSSHRPSSFSSPSTSTTNSFGSTPSASNSVFRSTSTSGFSSPFDAFENLNRNPQQSHSHHRQASHFPSIVSSSSSSSSASLPSPLSSPSTVSSSPNSPFSQFVSRDTPHQSDESKWKFHFAFHNSPNDNAHSTTSAHFQSAFTSDDDDSEGESLSPNVDLQREGRQVMHDMLDTDSVERYTSNKHRNSKNIVIPLPAHHFKDRSSGMIVISQDDGVFGNRNSNPNVEESDDTSSGRDFHYELLSSRGQNSENDQTSKTESVTPNKRDVGDNTIVSSSETVGDDDEDVTDNDASDNQRENENSNGDDSEDGGASTDDDNSGGDGHGNGNNNTANNDNSNNDNNNENDGSLAAAFTITMAHENDNKKVKGHNKQKFSSVADFISSKVAARIHLSRPKSSVNITLTHGQEMSHSEHDDERNGNGNGNSNKSADKVKSKFNRFNTLSSGSGDEGASLLLLVERETMLNRMNNKQRSTGQKKVQSEENSGTQIARSRRRPQPESLHNALADARKRTKATMAATTSTTTISTTTTTTSTTTTESPAAAEVSTEGAIVEEAVITTQQPVMGTSVNVSGPPHTVLNNLVKELNLALTDRIRQLETINETMMSMFGKGVPLGDEVTTTLAPTTITPTTTENSMQMSTVTSDAQIATTTTALPVEEKSEVTTVQPTEATELEAQSTTTTTPLTSLDMRTDSVPETTTTAIDVATADNSNEDEQFTTTIAPTTAIPEFTSTEMAPTTTTTQESVEIDNTTTLAPTPTTSSTTTTEPTVAPTTTTAVPTTTTTTTTTPVPTTTFTTTTTTTTTTTRAPVTSKPKRETSTKLVKITKSPKQSKKSTKPTQKPVVKQSGGSTSSLKLKMNVTLPGHRINEHNEHNLNGQQNSMNRRPALQLALGISSTSGSSDHKRERMSDFDDMPIIVERRAPSAPRIPNNFGFSNEVVEHLPQARRTSKSHSRHHHSHSQPAHSLFSMEPTANSDHESGAARFVRLAHVPSTTTTTTTTTTTMSPIESDEVNDSDEGDDHDNGDDEHDDESQSPEANVPGSAGVDYPILANIPDTGFDCAQQKYPGFYSDMSVGCQVYHSCSLAAIRAKPRRREPELEDDTEVAASSHMYSFAESRAVPRKISAASTRSSGTPGTSGMGGGGRHHSFLCPNGTIFSQEYLICDWWYNVKCDQSPKFYPLNRDVYSSGLPASSFTSHHDHQPQASVNSPISVSSVNRPLMVSAGGVRLHATTYRSSTRPASSHLSSAAPLHHHHSDSASMSSRQYTSYYTH